MKTEDELRADFEAWVQEPPYERSVERLAKSWPGQYFDLPVQLAWEAWQACAKKLEAEQ